MKNNILISIAHSAIDEASCSKGSKGKKNVTPSKILAILMFSVKKSFNLFMIKL